MIPFFCNGGSFRGVSPEKLLLGCELMVRQFVSPTFLLYIEKKLNKTCKLHVHFKVSFLKLREDNRNSEI